MVLLPQVLVVLLEFVIQYGSNADMALANYLLEGSYAVVESVTYTKSQNYINSILVIYKDKTKSEVLATKNIHFQREIIPALNGSFLSVPPPSEVLTPGSGFILARSGCKGEWIGRDGTFAVWNGTEWVFWGLGGGDIFYCEDSKTYLKLTPEYTLVPIEFYADYRIYDKWFKFSDSTMNIVSQIYKFLKSDIDSFKNCEDC